MDINVTTHEQQNIFVQKDIREGIVNTCDNPDMMENITISDMDGTLNKVQEDNVIITMVDHTLGNR